MNEFRENHQNQLDARLTEALESAPSPLIAEDFARRVMERLPARPVPSRYARALTSYSFTSHVGRRVAFAALVLLTFLMFWLAPTAFGMGHAALTVIELLLCAEFVGVVLWLSPLPLRER